MNFGRPGLTSTGQAEAETLKATMDQPLAYHGVVNALEARSGWTPMSRFVSAIAHVIDGHLPYRRYHAAGHALAARGTGEDVIERLVGDFIATDINPLATFFSSFRHVSGAVEAFNAYNASAQLGVRTNLDADRRHGSRSRRGGAKRSTRTDVDDPHLCRVGTLLAFDAILGVVRLNEASGMPAPPPSLLSVARHLGVEHSTAAEVALVFEGEGHVSIVEVAALLGVHQRTLERRLRSVGLTADALRQAARLMRATNRLAQTDSLTTIAADEGFADLAHMTRAFRASCGMPPSLMRKLLWADARKLAESAPSPASLSLPGESAMASASEAPSPSATIITSSAPITPFPSRMPLALGASPMSVAALPSILFQIPKDVDVAYADWLRELLTS